jgi:hypothetical protein
VSTEIRTHVTAVRPYKDTHLIVELMVPIKHVKDGIRLGQEATLVLKEKS